MSLLKPMTGSASYLKAGFLGFQGSGKTRTAVELATGVRHFFGSKKSVAFFDTESGSDFVKDLIENRTGQPLLGVKSRAFSDLLAVAEEAASEASVLIVDSISHVWRELLDSYLRSVNERGAELAEKNRRAFAPRRELEMSDWGIIKAKWAEWTDWFLNAPIHVIVCGRAGWDYEDREDEEGKTESVKVGVRMRAEADFGYEPALLVEMERVRRGDHAFAHRATVIKDKFEGALDGKQWEDPDISFFMPHVARLRPGGHQPVDTAVKTDHGLMGGDRSWYREKQDRAILSEEIDGEIQRAHPGQTAAEKQARRDLLERVFGTMSWTAISESTPSDRLRRGLAELREILRPAPSITDSKDPGDQLPEWSDASCGDDATPPASTPAPGAAVEASASPAPTEAAAPSGETVPGQLADLDAFFQPLPPADPTQERTSEPVPIPRGPEPPAKKKPGRKPKAAGGESPAAEPPVTSALGSKLLDEDMEVRELTHTLEQMDPAWIDSVESRILALPDARPEKPVLWGKLFAYKADVAMARAKAEAAARAVGP